MIMNTAIIRKTSFLLILTLMLASVSAQKILISQSGQRILLSTDGSWSILASDQDLDNGGQIIENQTTNLDAFQAPNVGKYPLTIDQKQSVGTIMKNLCSDEAQLLVNYEFFKNNIADIKENLALAKKMDDSNSIKALKEKLNLTEAAASKARNAYEESGRLIAKAQRLLDGEEKDASTKITDLQRYTVGAHFATSGMGAADISIPVSNPNAKSTENDGTSSNTTEYPTTFSVDRISMPREAYKCTLAYDGYDAALDAKRKQVESEYFFGFTQPKMKPYLKSEDFITCEAHVSKVGKKHYITLDIRIRSKDAQRTYGMLRAKESIRFEMVDGSKVYCENMIQNTGKIEPYTGHTLYTAIYEIQKDDLATLKKNYLDNVGIIWSSGFEQYNIFNVDFLKNQLQCLEK